MTDIDEANQHVASEPMIIKGEMIADEYQAYYGSAAPMLVRDEHAKIAKNKP